MTCMENPPLFLVICVSKVLIDDRRDVFPLSLEALTVSGGRKGVFIHRLQLQTQTFIFRPQLSATTTHVFAHTLNKKQSKIKW